MALYTEKSISELANLFNVDNQIRQNQLRQQQERAMQAYNTEKERVDNKYDGGLGGFLGQLVGGIGKFFGDIGQGVGGMIGTGIASAKDILEGKAATQENQLAFKRDWYKADNDKDAAAKAAGTSLNAAANLASFIPGVGAGTAAGKAAGSVGANAAMGALGGFGDEFQQQGADADLASATNRALAGGAAGLATGGLNRKLGNATSKVGSALLNNKVATSTLGRGALSGAVGGAVGGGTSAALGGGDVAQAALTGGLTGAAGGATQAGLMAGANKLGQVARNKVNTLRQQKNDLLGQSGSPLAANQEGGVTQTGTSLGEAEPLGARIKSVTQNKKNVNTDLMYGESKLGNRTKRGMTADALSRLGNTLEGAQTNVTRAAANDLGIESTGKVIESVRKKTGITSLDTQAALAKELTGGENSLMDSVQRQALSASEDGKPFKVDTTKVTSKVDEIVSKYADNNTFGSESKKRQFAQNIKNDISDGSRDVLTTANQMKNIAANSRGNGIVEPSPKAKATAKIYTEVANELDNLSYDAIPKSNIEDMFDVTISEMRGRAQQASANGNNNIAKAYNQLADSLDSQPRTIQAFRSFKKDFVDVSKISRLTNQAENGAAFQMGSSVGAGLKRGVNRLLERPVNAGLAMAGGLVNNVADAIDNITPTQTTNVQPLSQSTQNILGNIIGRTSGQMAASNNIQNTRKAADYQNLESLLTNAQTLGAVYDPTTGSLTASTTQSGMTNGLGAQTRATSQTEAQLANIANAMNLALSAGDLTSYSKLADLYQQAYKIYQLQNPQTTNDLTTSEKNQLAKLQSANTALDQLEELYNKAGGGQGVIAGNVANFLGGLGLNSDVSTYNQLAQGLINQIGAAIGKTDSLNTEGEVQRALSLVPKITDDAQTAKNKLATLRSLLQTNTGTYNQLYGA